MKKIPPLDTYDKYAIWWILIPLFYSLFYFMGFVFRSYNTEELIIYWGAYALFLALYFAAHYHSRFTHWYLLANGILVIAITPTVFSSYALLWHAAFFSAYQYSLKRGILLFTYLIACILLSASLINSNHASFLFSALLPLCSIYLLGHVIQRINRDRRIKHEQDQQIKSLATIAERERIARDMHDLLGHALTTIALKAELADKFAEANKWQQAQAEIKHVHELCRSSLSDVRQAVGNYKLRSLDEQIEQLSARLRDRGISVEKSITYKPCNAEFESTIILICTEAVTNILKHSNAKTVTIKLKRVNSKHILLSIEDNGQTQPIQQGNGIRGIRERARSFGAQLTLKYDQGLCLELVFDENSIS